MTSGVMRRKGGELSESVTGHSLYCCAPFVLQFWWQKKELHPFFGTHSATMLSPEQCCTRF